MPKKMSALQILQERERKRRLVPAIVLKRRVALAVTGDPATAVLSKAKRLSKRHALTMRDLVIRTMGLTNTPDTLAGLFLKEGMDDIKMDGTASSLITNASRKISEILIFQMVANELINDPAMRTRIIDLFIEQRFETMRSPPKHDAPPPASPPQDRSHKPAGRQELLELLSSILDT